jgi:putative transposase
MRADQRHCDPLTTTDFGSRYLIGCDALETTQEVYAFTVFERTFKDFGLPCAIRADNALPCSSARAIFGLSKLSVWWLRLGIAHVARGGPAANCARL